MDTFYLILKIVLLVFLFSLLNYFVITLIVDICLMGKLRYCHALKCKMKEFIIKKTSYFDYQEGFKCSAFSSAYVLRHHDYEATGNKIYEEMPNKMQSGYVYPKGITNLLTHYSFKVDYCTGSVEALKNEVCKGKPVIVMIRIQADKGWLHYVPVVGFDEENIYLAESIKELANCENPLYNRKIAIKDFKKLWNTRMLKMPFYGNTFFRVEK